MAGSGPKTNSFSRGGRTNRTTKKGRITLRRSKGKQGRRYNARYVGTKRAIRKK